MVYCLKIKEPGVAVLFLCVDVKCSVRRSHANYMCVGVVSVKKIHVYDL